MQSEPRGYEERLDELLALSFDDFLVLYQEWAAQPGRAEGTVHSVGAPLTFAKDLAGVPLADATPQISEKYAAVQSKLDAYGERYASGIARISQ